MPEILQRLRLPCNASEARLHYPKMFRSQSPAERALGLLQLTLRVPMVLPALEGDVFLQRDVMVTLARGRASYSDLSVDWEPAGGGQYPRFSGLIRTEDFDLKGCAAILEGDSGLTNSGLPAASIAQGYQASISTARMVLHGIRSMVRAFETRAALTDVVELNGTEWEQRRAAG